jgi:hypothetical protein
MGWEITAYYFEPGMNFCGVFDNGEDDYILVKNKTKEDIVAHTFSYVDGSEAEQIVSGDASVNPGFTIRANSGANSGLLSYSLRGKSLTAPLRERSQILFAYKYSGGVEGSLKLDTGARPPAEEETKQGDTIAARKDTPAVEVPSEKKEPAAAAAAGGEKKADAAAKSDTAAKDMDPQRAASSMSVQDKIRTSAMAVDTQVGDMTETGVITIEDVMGSNPTAADQKWITNSDTDRAEFTLSDWSSGSWGEDKYTYFALIDTKTGKPIAFVVASDPEENNHFSTGRFIGPTSQRQNLKRAFCYLYHRATGKPHETCDDGATTGPNDDVLKGSGRGGGKGRGGKGSGAGSGKTGSSGDAGAGGGEGDLRTAAWVKQDAGGVVGRGDVKVARYFGAKALTSYEKVKKNGKKIIALTINEHGFEGFPDRNWKFQYPRSIAVHLNTSVQLKSGAEEHTVRADLSEIKPENILKFKYGFVGPTPFFWARIHTIERGDKKFDRAVAWLFANKEQFNLLSDNDESKAAEHEDEAEAAEESEQEVEKKGKEEAEGEAPAAAEEKK